MLIVADENIPAVTEVFSAFGTVQLLQGREMRASDIRYAEALLVRSVTRVNRDLLNGSRVGFVGSATIGTDHIDLSWLKSRGVEFANAPGCNAVAAAEYVILSVLLCARRNHLDLLGSTVGIIGCGNVGSRVQARFEAIGLKCLVCDPPRAEREGTAGFVDMETISGADIITVHIPLERSGDHPTFRLISSEFIESLKPGAILINTSRGEISDENALKKRLIRQDDIYAVLDVWENEPGIDPELVEKVAVATPHIAGHSIDGKLRATGQLYEAWCQFSHAAREWDYQRRLPDPEEPLISLRDIESPLEAISAALPRVYNISRDDRDLRNLCSDTDKDTGAGFDLLRKCYPVRRECRAYRIAGRNLSESVLSTLRKFGFALA